MLFFGSDKPIISKLEFQTLKSRLYSKGWSQENIDNVELIFRGDLNEDGDTQSGIDKNEIEKAVSWLRANMNKHRLSSEKITEIETELKSFL